MDKQCFIKNNCEKITIRVNLCRTCHSTMPSAKLHEPLKQSDHCLILSHSAQDFAGSVYVCKRHFEEFADPLYM